MGKKQTQPPVLYTRESLAVVHGASDEDTRPVLTGVYLDPNGDTIGCSGHVLFRVSKPTLDAADFPVRKGVTPRQIDKAGIIMPKETARAVAKQIPKKTMLPVLEHAQLVAGTASDTVALLTTDLENDHVANFKPIKDPYPNYRRTMPQEKAYKVPVTSEPQARCANCEQTFNVSDLIPLAELPDLGKHLDPGSEVPAGGCPVKHCKGSFCYLTEESKPWAPRLVIGLSARLLESLVKFVKAARSDWRKDFPDMITFTFYRPSAAVSFDAGENLNTGQHVDGLIMPMRLPK